MEQPDQTIRRAIDRRGGYVVSQELVDWMVKRKTGRADQMNRPEAEREQLELQVWPKLCHLLISAQNPNRTPAYLTSKERVGSSGNRSASDRPKKANDSIGNRLSNWKPLVAIEWEAERGNGGDNNVIF